MGTAAVTHDGAQDMHSHHGSMSMKVVVISMMGHVTGVMPVTCPCQCCQQQAQGCSHYSVTDKAHQGHMHPGHGVMDKGMMGVARGTLVPRMRQMRGVDQPHSYFLAGGVDAASVWASRMRHVS